MKKLVIFDMDETLIHCLGSQKYKDKAVKKNEWGVILSPENADAVLKGWGRNGKEDWKQYVNIRPYARKCIKYLSKHFQVIVFTASH